MTPSFTSKRSGERLSEEQSGLMSSSPGLVIPRSQLETVVVEALTRSANSACVQPRTSLASRM
jgi:hypothetical protein